MPDESVPSRDRSPPAVEPAAAHAAGAAAVAPAGHGWRANLRALASAVGRTRPREPEATRLPLNPWRTGDEQRSLFGEILDWMLAPLLLVWPMSVTITYLAAQSVANAPYDRMLSIQAQILADHVALVDDRVRLRLPPAARQVLAADSTDTIHYMVLGLRGEFVEGERSLPLPPEDETPFTGRVKLRDGQLEGTDLRIAYTWVDLGGPDHAQPVLVQFAETLDKRAQLANEIIRGVIVPQFIVLPISVALVWFGLTRGLAPLNLLQRRIRERRPDDLSPINPQAAPEELGPLVTAFNDLLQRMTQNLETQKRFVAHAAHQMKTPLAGLRTQAELALRETDAAQLQRSLRQIAASTERAAHLINQMLALARAEHQATDLAAFTVVDATALVREVVAEFVPQAVAKGIDLGLEAQPARPQLIGIPLLLRELLNNLLDNALRYTPAGGAVTVRIRSEPKSVRVEVEDTGPGIPPAEQHLVFERFYRVLGTNIDGSGLGLAIVREIAQQHGALLRVGVNPRSTAPGLPGTLISVEFPDTLAQAPGIDRTPG